jgi:hypothetical protein
MYLVAHDLIHYMLTVILGINGLKSQALAFRNVKPGLSIAMVATDVFQ